MSKELTISQAHIENKIYHVRGVQVMLDSDLAEVYQTETKYINRAIKRNPNRFPTDFAFQLNDAEWENLKFQFGTSSAHGGRRTLPYAFTEQGVAMLSSVLQSDLAVKVSVQIIKAFVVMRKIIAEFNKSHDRFLIIDEQEVYHLGASLKDLGKKWFAFSRLEKNSITSILNEIRV